MSFDLAEMIVYVAVGIFGAVVGALLWRIVINLFRAAAQLSVGSLLFMGLGIMLAMIFLPDRINEKFGPNLRDFLPKPNLVAEAREDPFIDRVLSDHPELGSELEQRLVAAYVTGGRERVRLEKMRYGQAVATSPQFDYFLRARSIDLVAVMTAQRDVLAIMAHQTPDLCYPFLFGVDADDFETSRRIIEAVPEHLAAYTNVLVVNAYDEIPYYDRSKGRGAIERAQVQATLVYGDRGMSLLAGERRPASVEEEELVCRVFLKVLTTILDEGDADASLAFRAMFDAS